MYSHSLTDSREKVKKETSQTRPAKPKTHRTPLLSTGKSVSKSGRSGAGSSQTHSNRNKEVPYILLTMYVKHFICMHG